MTRCADHHIGAKLCAIPDIDVRIIHEREIMIDVHVMSKVEKTPTPVSEERRFNETGFADSRQHPIQKLCALLRFTRSRLVEIEEELHMCFLYTEELFIQALVERAIVQLRMRVHDVVMVAQS